MSSARLLLATLLLLGCAASRTHPTRSPDCRELVVEADDALPTKRGAAETRSATRLWIDTHETPHVGWISGWSLVSPMGRWQYQLHHASLERRRWKLEHLELPPELRWPDAIDFDGEEWFLQELVDGEQQLWTGAPWRRIDATRADALRLRALYETNMGGRTQPESPWPDDVRRDHEYDRFAIATGDARSVTVGIGWQPRGRATDERHPHGEPYRAYPNKYRGRGTLVVWLPDPIAVPSVHLRRHYWPQVEIDGSAAIHVLLVDSLSSDFSPNRYVRLRCRS